MGNSKVNKFIKLQRGFTLIELVAVIIVLGILAVIAAPKFIDVSSDARKASLQGLKGAVTSTMQMAHLSCQLTDGCIDATWGQVIFVPQLNSNVQILRGYPDAGEINRTDQIDDLIDYDGFELTSQQGNETARWSIEGTTDCYVDYRQPSNDLNDPPTPTITIVDTGC